ncbi:Uncharacterised protein [Mycobacterium tuberculosis]|nr:Uncharacterised protein [Mycobacterium tuberculosis]
MSRFSSFRSIGIVYTWFSSRPTCDRALQFIEDPDVDAISGTLLGNKLSHTIVIVVIICKFQDCFIQMT